MRATDTDAKHIVIIMLAHWSVNIDPTLQSSKQRMIELKFHI